MCVTGRPSISRTHLSSWASSSCSRPSLAPGADRLVKGSSHTRAEVAKTLKLRVPESEAGVRLDRFLAALPDIGSRAAADALLESGNVLVEGAPRRRSYRLGQGDEVEVELAARKADSLEAEDVPLRIAWEDEHLLVVDKPSGVVVHPAP